MRLPSLRTPRRGANDADAAAPQAGVDPYEPGVRPTARERGRARRRLRLLRRARELGLRDLGGLVLAGHRFARPTQTLVADKAKRLIALEDELRKLEQWLDERSSKRELREPGIGGTCQVCFALHGSYDRFCARCGRSLSDDSNGGSDQDARSSAEQTDATTPPAG